MTIQSPSYVTSIYEFLSSFIFNEQRMQLSFCLGNENFIIGVFELNDVFYFPKGEEAQIKYDTDEFWRNITGQRGVFYEARSAKESQI